MHVAWLLAAIMIPLTAASGQTVDEVADLRQQVEEMRAREAAALKRVEDLERRLGGLERQRVSDADAAAMRGKGQNVTRATRFGDTVALIQDQDPGAGGSSEPDRKTPAPTAAVEDVSRQQLGISNDRFGLEAGVTYSHFNNARINLNGFLALDAIFLGTISIDQLRADVVTFDVTGRFSPTDRLQFDANVPYLFRHSNFQSGGAGGASTSLAEKSVRGDGLGDVSFGASYRLFKETARRPDVVLSARIKAPTGRHPFGVELIEVPGTEGNLAVPAELSTGSGVWGASAGISVLKTIDPLVVFGSASYFHNFKRKFKDIDEAEGDQPGQVKLGNAFQWGAGVAFALNESSSLSMSFTQRLINRSAVKREGASKQIIVGSQGNVGLVNLGATFAINDKISVVSTVGLGLTDDAPDMSVGVRVPLRF